MLLGFSSTNGGLAGFAAAKLNDLTNTGSIAGTELACLWAHVMQCIL